MADEYRRMADQASLLSSLGPPAVRAGLDGVESLVDNKAVVSSTVAEAGAVAGESSMGF